MTTKTPDESLMDDSKGNNMGYEYADEPNFSVDPATLKITEEEIYLTDLAFTKPDQRYRIMLSQAEKIADANKKTAYKALALKNFPEMRFGQVKEDGSPYRIKADGSLAPENDNDLYTKELYEQEMAREAEEKAADDADEPGIQARPNTNEMSYVNNELLYHPSRDPALNPSSYGGYEIYDMEAEFQDDINSAMYLDNFTFAECERVLEDFATTASGRALLKKVSGFNSSGKIDHKRLCQKSMKLIGKRGTFILVLLGIFRFFHPEQNKMIMSGFLNTIIFELKTRRGYHKVTLGGLFQSKHYTGKNAAGNPFVITISRLLTGFMDLAVRLVYLKGIFNPIEHISGSRMISFPVDPLAYKRSFWLALSTVHMKICLSKAGAPAFGNIDIALLNNAGMRPIPPGLEPVLNMAELWSKMFFYQNVNEFARTLSIVGNNRKLKLPVFNGSLFIPKVESQRKIDRVVLSVCENVESFTVPYARFFVEQATSDGFKDKTGREKIAAVRAHYARKDVYKPIVAATKYELANVFAVYTRMDAQYHFGADNSWMRDLKEGEKIFDEFEEGSKMANQFGEMVSQLEDNGNDDRL